MSESGPEPGAAGSNRWSDRHSALPPIDQGEPDEDQRSTTALPRPSGPPPTEPPFDPRYDSPAARPTTALPRTPSPGFVSGYPDPVFPAPARPAPAAPARDARDGGYIAPEPSGGRRGGYTGAIPSGTGDRGFQRLDPRVDQAPVGPSWAPQHPYDAEPGRGADRSGGDDPAGRQPPGRPADAGQYRPGDGRDGDRGYDRYPDPGALAGRPAGYRGPDAGPGYGAQPRYPSTRDDQAARTPAADRDHHDRERPDRGYSGRDHTAQRGYSGRDDTADRGYSGNRGYSGDRSERPAGQRPDQAQDDPPARDYPLRDYQPRDYPPPRDYPGDHAYRYPADRGDPTYPARDRSDQDHPARDYTERGHPARDYPARDYPDPDRESAYPGEPDGYDQPPSRRPPPRGSHLPPYSEPLTAGSAAPPDAAPTGRRSPRKLTVTRVAAFRSRELTHRGVELFHKATTADGADKSGLTSLTYAVMANYAVDAALAVALAGTLFFAAATAESTGRVLLYLVITVAPFAVIAPFIGPMLDRLQNGRRLALAVSSFGRALLALLMAFNFSNFNPWVIYPCALGNLVLSKAFGVLKAALTPRVLPEQITLVKTNSRLTTFGMIAGGVAGAVAAGLSKITGSPGALFFTAACAVAGGVLCLRIPAWVESTEGEVPVREVGSDSRSRGFPQIVRATLWANSVIRVETGFLALFIAFVVKSQYPSPQYSAFTQLLLLGVVGGAAGVGGFVGNTMGARLTLSAPETISIFALVSVLVSTIIAVLVPGLATAAIVGFVGSTASALAKVSLDSVIQHHLPEESRASAFGKSESVLQLGWVFGGVVGLLLGGVWTFGHDSVYAIGFGTVTLMLVIGLVQSYLVRSGRTMVPKLMPKTGRRSGGSRREKKQGEPGPSAQRGDTDRLTRPAPAGTAQLPAVEATPRRRPRKAGGDR